MIKKAGAVYSYDGERIGQGRDNARIYLKEHPEMFDELEQKIIGKPLIEKVRRSYLLPDGLVLEVNHVDAGQPTEFWYAEVEYRSVEQARAWDPSSCGLAEYLNDDVTDQPGQSMGEYWNQTRMA